MGERIGDAASSSECSIEMCDLAHSAPRAGEEVERVTHAETLNGELRWMVGG